MRVLREVDVIAAEDTRRTRILLRHHGIDRPLTSYYDAVERDKAPRLVAQMVAGKRFALVSDAGTPGVADPGYHLVRAAVAAGVPVVPIPGVSSVVTLVSVSGLAVDRFAFEGFLPPRDAARRKRLEALADEPRAMVFLETGRRLAAFLEGAADAFGERETVIGRELTKLHEELMRGTLPSLRDRVRESDGVLGEVTVVVAGAPERTGPADEASLDDEIRAAHAAGMRVRELSAAIAQRHGLSRRIVYQRALVVLGTPE
ncbi:MAG TPA: 16S rRNA (cytidine(1402)-2'-O)-methyltransferase [Candidatus Binatia bacterium]|nr:16S rRNA (cytidine(1402)-2'-O)-methyltransferase [Candidatus Binatia bacterium]